MKILSHSRRCRPAGIGLVGEEVFPSIRNPDHQYQNLTLQNQGPGCRPALRILLAGWRDGEMQGPIPTSIQFWEKINVHNFETG
jgi:hypothetical protein